MTPDEVWVFFLPPGMCSHEYLVPEAMYGYFPGQRSMFDEIPAVKLKR